MEWIFWTIKSLVRFFFRVLVSGCGLDYVATMYVLLGLREIRSDSLSLELTNHETFLTPSNDNDCIGTRFTNSHVSPKKKECDVNQQSNPTPYCNK